MRAAPHPLNRERLKTLYSYEILDTEREEVFDEIVALVAAICGTEIAVINLIDAERQWFKAEVGLNADETPLATSLCSHVILQDAFVEINDTLDDPRMADNPLCCGDPGLRFYAGALLVADNGLPIGTLCVLDHAPRQLTALQRDTIRVLARQVMNQLDLRRALKRAEVMRQEVDHRVKNSLQSVSSLTRLQARQVDSEAAREALDVVQRRIETVAALHEQLYRTDAGNSIDLRQYFENIETFIRGSAPEDATVSCISDPFMVGSQEAAALGVVINEFAANSIKHAFGGDRPGELTVSARLDLDGIVHVELRDNGPGLAAPSDGRGGIGMQVIEASVEQLGGTYRLHPEGPGLHASLTFPQNAGTPRQVA